jgi:D-amino-acid dehydrogenase
MPERHVVIVGAGVIGAVSAVEALRAGHRVTIVDPGEPGGEQAASYGNAGWLSSHSVIPPALPGIWRKIPSYVLDPLGPLTVRWAYLPKAAPWLVRYLLSGSTPARIERTAQALRTLLVDAPSLHLSLAREAGVEHLIRLSGLLHVYPTRADFEAEALAWRIRRDVGISWLELTADELRQREPLLNRRYRFGVLVEEAGHCLNPGRYVAALVSHARKGGAALVAGRAVGLRIESGRLRAVCIEGGEIACDGAAITAGAYSRHLAKAAGDRLPLETERGYHVSIKGQGAGPRTPLMAADCKMIATATETGLRAAGQVEIAGLEAQPNWARADVLKRHVLSMFEGLPRDLPPECMSVWMGRRPSMPDGLPCIGRSSASADVVYAFGHGHIGLGSSARTGRLVAQLLSGCKTEIDLSPFDPRRFKM